MVGVIVWSYKGVDMRKNDMIENTVLNTVKFANVTKLLFSKTLAYVYKDNNDLERIYKMVHPKMIYFNLFGIEKYASSQIPSYFDSKYEKRRLNICMVILKSIVYEYIADKTAHDVNEECFKFAAKWIVNHKKEMHKFVGQVDISGLADLILQPCKMYEDFNNR